MMFLLPASSSFHRRISGKTLWHWKWGTHRCLLPPSWHRQRKCVSTISTGTPYASANHSSLLHPTVGAPLSGWISDKIVIRYKKLRGYWFPEDRLRACLFSFYLPITVLASGLITRYIPGTFGLVLNLVCFFINGIGVSAFLLAEVICSPWLINDWLLFLPCKCDIALTPCGAYVVDVLHSNSAEVTAAVKWVSLFFSDGWTDVGQIRS